MKKILTFLFIFLCSANICLAEEIISVQITPNQIISTKKDATEFGDILKFKTTRDVYKDGTLIIKKGAPVIAYVDYVEGNSFFFVSANIHLKDFQVLNTQNKWIKTDAKLQMIGSKCRNPKRTIFCKTGRNIASFFMGDEVYVENSQKNFNIIIDSL